MEKSELITQIRARVDKCRRLASGIADDKAAAALLQIACDGEATIAKLEVETVSD